MLEDNEKKILAAKNMKFDITKKCLEQGLNKDPPACVVKMVVTAPWSMITSEIMSIPLAE